MHVCAEHGVLAQYRAMSPEQWWREVVELAHNGVRTISFTTICSSQQARSSDSRSGLQEDCIAASSYLLLRANLVPEESFVRSEDEYRGAWQGFGIRLDRTLEYLRWLHGEQNYNPIRLLCSGISGRTVRFVSGHRTNEDESADVQLHPYIGIDFPDCTC